jgi:ketosteroid isomerase-like protein
MEDLESRIRTLETELGILKDRAAIQDLRFRYHIAVNEKDLEAIPRLFTEDAEVEFEGIGSARGQLEIDALYREVVGASPFIKQFIHNHVIDLDGDSGTGLSYLDARTVANGKSMLVAARFDDEYRRQAGGWMFRALRLKLFFAVPLQDGWAGEDQIQLG